MIEELRSQTDNVFVQPDSTVFRTETTAVFWGEATQILRDCIPDQSVDLIFADPPYNIGKQFGKFRDRWDSDEAYAQWCYQWLDLCLAKLKANGSLYVMSSTQGMPYLDLYLRNRIEIMSRIVWFYDSSGVQARNYYGSLYEPILFCVNDRKNYTFNAEAITVEAKTGAKRKLVDYRKPVPTLYNSQKVPGNVWEIPRVRYRMDEYEEHPSQKPEALLQRIILASSNPGDTILDPFAGTFTTCAVAQALNRVSIGIEQEVDYVKVGLRRLNIQQEWNGETLARPSKSYQKPDAAEQPALFERR